MRRDGWAALNLEMPDRVPRTEYSAEGHWDLIKAVTGIDVSVESPGKERHRASLAFIKAWKYDFLWNTLIGGEELSAKHTSMGHAEYAAGAEDWNPEVHCPFTDPEEVLSLDMDATYGVPDHGSLVRQFEDHYGRAEAEFPDCVNMTGIYTTCISGLLDIFGWDMLLLAAGEDLKRFGDLTNRYCAWIERYFDALAVAKVPAAMIHDDMVWTSGPIFHPDWYRAYVFPNLKRLLGKLRDSGKKVLFTADGNYSAFIDDLADCGVDCFVMEPTTDMAYIAERYGRTHSFVGNADTRILLSGSKTEIRAEVERCMAIGKGCPGFFMAVGNHIPANTPVESALYYNEVYEELSRR
jgi:hypothetical protein